MVQYLNDNRMDAAQNFNENQMGMAQFDNQLKMAHIFTGNVSLYILESSRGDSIFEDESNGRGHHKYFFFCCCRWNKSCGSF